MVEFTTQFCDSASFSQTALRQYGRYEKDADFTQLPILNEHTVITYITEGSGSLKLGSSMHTIEPGSILVMFPDVCVNASALHGPIQLMWAEMSGDALPKILARAGLTPQKPILSLADLGDNCKTKSTLAQLTAPDAELGALAAYGLAMEMLDYLVQESPRPCQPKVSNLQQYYVEKSIRYIKTKYPQGGERTLIYAVTGREINSTMLPADVGCVVDNVETVTSVYKAVILGQPVISRNVTVTGDGIRTPKNFSVLTGTDLSELVDAAGGLKEKIAKAISGGPMMGFALYDLHIPCTKTTSSLLFLERDAVSEAKQIQTACINCGRCVSVCPGHVVPARLATLAEHGDMAGFEKMDGMECCECGCCSYICPAKRPLTQSIKSMRKMVLAERKKKK